MAPIYSVVVLRKNPPGSEKAPSENDHTRTDGGAHYKQHKSKNDQDL